MEINDYCNKLEEVMVGLSDSLYIKDNVGFEKEFIVATCLRLMGLEGQNVFQVFNWLQLLSMNSDLFKDKDFINELQEKHRIPAVAVAPFNLKDDFDFMLHQFKLSNYNIGYASPRLLSDWKFAFEIVMIKPDFIYYFSPLIRSDFDLVFECYRVLGFNENTFRRFARRIKDSKEIISERLVETIIERKNSILFKENLENNLELSNNKKKVNKI